MLNLKSLSTESARKPVVISLLVLHLCAYLAFSVWGEHDPFELFNILLIVSNITIAALLLLSKKDLLIGGGVMFFIATHGFIGHRLAPDSLTNGAILMVNILVLYVGIRINENLSRKHWYALIGSFFVLFFVFIVHLNNSEALFLLFLMLMAACARNLKLLTYFWFFTLAFTFFQPFAWEAMLVSFFILTAVFNAKGLVDSAMAKLFLAVGLVLLLFVLLPIIIAVMNEPLVNIEPVLRDPKIREALWRTFFTATVSTIILFFIAIPLAYAISRLRFPGRTMLMSLIDLPVVIPQSVAGIALISVLGRNQYIGQLIFDMI